MKRIQGFVLGVLATVLVVSLTTTALAAGGYISFNRVNIRHNGTQIGAAGEDYVLDNGCVAPYSLSYTDEKGGNTTYLPVRKVSELLGVNISWDGTTKTVTIGREPTKVNVDYANWTDEQNAEYEKFASMWTLRDSNNELNDIKNKLVTFSGWANFKYTGTMTKTELDEYIKEIGEDKLLNYSVRFVCEFLEPYAERLNIESIYYFEDEEIFVTACDSKYLDSCICVLWPVS